MRVLVTTTKIIQPGKTVGRTITGDRHIEGSELEFYSGEGSNLAILDRLSGTIYQTDFAYSGVAAVLVAAPTTGGHFNLT